MRFVLGALLLLALFALAKRWQEGWTDELRSERDRALARQELPSDDRAPVVGRVVVGVHSGAPAFEGSGAARSASGTNGEQASAANDARATTASTAPPEDPIGASEPAPTGKSEREAAARVFQLTVRGGDQLGELCRKYYGSGRRELIDALARYNHMASPDQLREGQKLLLPPIETLLGERR